MSILIQCLNCGKSISSKSYECIHCKARRCRICQRYDKSYGNLKQVCRECGAAIQSAKLPQNCVFSVQVKCSLCGHDNKLSSKDHLNAFNKQKPYLSKHILSPRSSVRHNYREGAYTKEPEENHQNIEYGFLSPRAVRNQLFGSLGCGIGGQRYNQRKHPNDNIKNFLGDSIYIAYFTCSSCGESHQRSEVVFPVKYKEFQCAVCEEYGKLETMDVLVRHYQKHLSGYEDTLCEFHEEIRLAHRSCLKYRNYLVNSNDSYSYSLNKPNVECEIWSVEQVLTQANLIEEMIKKRVKINDFICSKEVWIPLIFVVVFLMIIAGWIGFFVSCIMVVVYLTLITSNLT